MRRFHTAPLVGLQQALCTHAAVTGRFYSRPSPVSSFQLGSYKHAVSPSRLAPPAGSLKGCLRGPLRHSFWAAPKGPFIQFGTILPNLWQKVKYKFQRCKAAGKISAAGMLPAGPMRLPPGLRARVPCGLPPAGPLLDAQKWAEKPPGRPRAPVVCPIGRLQRSTRLPLNFWLSFEIGALRIQLRLTALVLIGVSFLWTKACAESDRRRKTNIENQIRPSL